MASPQLENGHSRLANELLEALIKCPPASVAARQIWDWVWRQSWGWKGAATTRPASVRALAEAIGTCKTTAAKAIGDLLATNHVLQNEDGSFSIQKDHEKWHHVNPGARALPVQKQMVLIEYDGEKGPENDPENCPHGADKLSARRGQKRPHGADKNVRTARTRTIRNLKKERNRKSAASGAAPVFSQPENDTPRRRAEIGDPERPPEEHPNFGKLGFRRRDELTDQWKDNVAKKRCRKNCGRPKASDTWNFCRPCTACAKCGAKPGDGKIFTAIRAEIVCNDCKEPTR